MSEEQIKMIRPSQVEVPGTKETFTSMRHVLAVDKESRAAEIPQQLKGGQKLSAIPKERVEDALNNLQAHMQSTPEMYWPMSWKTGASHVTIFGPGGGKVVPKEQIVQYFLSRQKGLVPGDWANTRLPWYRKNYPAMFNFTQVSRATTKWTAVEQEPDTEKTERPEPTPAEPRPTVHCDDFPGGVSLPGCAEEVANQPPGGGVAVWE